MEPCYCGGRWVETATAGVYRCTGCGDIVNDWGEEDEDAE